MNWTYYSDVFFNIPVWVLALRMALAVICGGAIGIEREYKLRPAGLRTYIIVCLSATLIMTIGEGLAIGASNIGINSDPARLGAQVISGIGFLGAGTIIVTGKKQVKGLTTAAGLWGSACIGLAIGCGFYIGAAVTTTCILLVLALMTKLDKKITSEAPYVNLLVEFESANKIADVLGEVTKLGVVIFDVQLSKSKINGEYVNSAVLNLKLSKKMTHQTLLVLISTIDGVSKVQEI